MFGELFTAGSGQHYEKNRGTVQLLYKFPKGITLVGSSAV